MGIRTNTLLLSLILSCSVWTSAQVTIGSAIEPAEGAILDLKEEGETKKGLGLPRVSLKGRTSLEPCLTADDNNDSDERLSHIGLLVYNVNVIDGMTNNTITKNEMLCEGLHVWNGEEWKPLVKYHDPDVTRSGRKEDLTIKRGPGDSEVTTYTTAYFHGYSRKSTAGRPMVGSVYVCDPNNLVEIDAGQWMTMNLNTEYLPNETVKIEYHTKDKQKVAQYIDVLPVGTPSVEDKRKNGLLYNWNAATANRDPNGILTSTESTTPRIQGICPSGWHLPDRQEMEELKSLYAAQYYKFSNVPYGSSLASEARISTAMTSQFEGQGQSHTPEEGGIDWRRVGARWSNWNTQSPPSGYGKSGFWWSSTSGPADTSTASPDLWQYRGYRLTNGFKKGISIIPDSNGEVVTSLYASRVILQSVRCKKD